MAMPRLILVDVIWYPGRIRVTRNRRTQSAFSSHARSRAGAGTDEVPPTAGHGNRRRRSGGMSDNTREAIDVRFVRATVMTNYPGMIRA